MTPSEAVDCKAVFSLQWEEAGKIWLNDGRPSQMACGSSWDFGPRKGEIQGVTWINKAWIREHFRHYVCAIVQAWNT